MFWSFEITNAPYSNRQTSQKPTYFVFIFGPVSEKKFKYGILRA